MEALENAIFRFEDLNTKIPEEQLAMTTLVLTPTEIADPKPMRNDMAGLPKPFVRSLGVIWNSMITKGQ